MNMEKLKLFWNKYGMLFLFIIGGIFGPNYIDNPDIAVILKVAGIMSAFLVVTSVVLDDRAGKGLFPSYDEDALIQKALETPMSAACVILIKNVFLLVLFLISLGIVKP